MIHYSVDLGTTNSVVAKWDNAGSSVHLLEFAGVSRGQQEGQLIKNEHAVPSAVYIGDMKRFLFFKRQKFEIGKAALEKETYTRFSRVITNFKPALLRSGYDILKKVDKKSYSARAAARIFMEQISRLIKQQDGAPMRSLTFTVPVDCYEPYRAQLKQIARGLHIRKFRLVDEPVAAAIGYGLRIDEPQNVLVFDFGGGTLDLALVRIDEKVSGAGRCTVLAKEGVPIGGNVIDRWLVDHFCKKTGYSFDKNDITGGLVWNNLLLEEARRIKENLFFRETETFYLVPPKEYQSFEIRVFAEQRCLDQAMDITRDDFINVLTERGLYHILESTLSAILDSAARMGIGRDEISSVLMVGGSSLLPNVHKLFEDEFGRSRVQSWQPFNAVAYGGAIFAAGKMVTSDFIVHDYAFVTHNAKTLKPEYNVIVPRYTPFPTAPDFWKRRLTPTCSRGLPEKIFKLLICEIGRKHHNYQEFLYDKDGRLHNMEDGDKKIIIPLNEDDPVLGTLNPPHQPGNREARLEISFMINEDKWLCATVYDLSIRTNLMKNEPIVRLR